METFQSPAKRRIDANASGLAERVLEFLRDFPIVPIYEYATALGVETVSLKPEPVRSKIRNIWFEHLESRDAGRSSSYFSDSNVRISRSQGLILEVFQVALKQAPEVARELLQRNSADLTPSVVGRPTIDGTTLHLAARGNCPLVLGDLLEIIRPFDAQERENIIGLKDRTDRTVLTIAVEECNLEAVRILVEEQPELLDTKWGIAEETPLHIAVELAAKQTRHVDQIPEIIEVMVERRPATLYAHNKEGSPPFYCARMLETVNSEVCTKVSQMLRSYIIKYWKHDIQKARDAMYGRAEHNKELGLDFSDFNRPSHDFAEFVRAIYRDSEAMQNLEFDRTLFHVVLPDFFHRTTTEFHGEVSTFFNWLATTAKVTHIVELVIPDSYEKPMEDDFIQHTILDKFFVTTLDWRKLDINIQVLTESLKTRDSLQEVQLYSSGNWGVLYHWASDDGLYKLHNLKSEGTVRIRIIQRKLSRGRVIFYPLRLPEYKVNTEGLFKAAGLKCFVSIGDFDIAAVNIHGEDTSIVARLGLSADYKDCHDAINAIESEMSIFSNNLKDYPVKVAIIDNGADKVRTTFSDNIKEGISYVTGGGGKYLKSWWHVADPHGTQMASIICEINPHCHLYIARVGTGRKDIDSDKAVLAIDWAIARNVDIISISWTTKENHPALRSAIGRATAKNILVICSTADEGEVANQVYPARWPPVITVSALDASERRRGKSQKDVDVLVLGEDVPAIGPTYIKDKALEAVSGSSVATAVTTGIASLILVLARGVNRKEEFWDHFRRPEEMKDLFSKLMGTQKNHKNHIVPAKLFRDLSKGKIIWAPNFMHPDEVYVMEVRPTGNMPAGRMMAEPQITSHFTTTAQTTYHGGDTSSRSTTWHSALSEQISIPLSHGTHW